KCPAATESESFVKDDAAFICGVDAADEYVQLCQFGPAYELQHQQIAKAAPAVRLVHVDAVFHRVLVGRKSAERAPTCEAEQCARVVDRANDWEVAEALRREPGGHRLWRSWHVVVERSRVDDGFVQYVQNGHAVFGFAAVDEP